MAQYGIRLPDGRLIELRVTLRRERAVCEPDPEYVPLPFLSFDEALVPASGSPDPRAQAAAHFERLGLSPEGYYLGEPEYRMPQLWEGDQA